MTEPAVGASTCASGSQVCTGNMGILTAKAIRNAKNSQVCSFALNGIAYRSASWKLPPLMYRYTRPTSISTEPRNVYRKNFNEA